MLVVKDLWVRYDEIPVLRGVSLEVREGELVALVGANGAGKSTFLKTVAGLLTPYQGDVLLEGRSLVGLPPHQIVRQGIALVPEGRRLFTRLTVYENLLTGAATRPDPQERRQMLEEVFDLFPRLAERRHQKAGTLSGGEQQMLAIARALMARPRLLMLDEPSLGLMPKLVDLILETLQRLNREQGMTILLVEQNVREALDIARRGYVLQSGRIVMQGTGQELLASEEIQRAYLGM